MKIEDLRVGNHLFSNEVSGIVEVSGISKDIIQFEHKGSILYDCVSRFQSVKLTEEILLECGFIAFGQGYIHKNMRYTDLFKIREDGFIVFVANDNYITKLKYLHELQNIIYYLTKKEL